MKLAQIITKALNDNDPRCHSDEDIYGESNNYNFNLKKRKNKLKN